MAKKAKPAQTTDSSVLLERVAAFYEKNLCQSRKGLDYLTSLGLADSDCLSALRVGYCNGTLTETLPDSGQVLVKLTDLGILNAKGREFFNQSVVFPVCDADGAVISLVGRRVTDRTNLHLPKPPSGIWNIRACGLFSDVLMTTTVIDGLCLQVAGYTNVCAAFKTLSESDLSLLCELGVRKITLVGSRDQVRTLTGVLGQFTLETSICRAKSLTTILLKSGTPGIEALVENASTPPTTKKDSPKLAPSGVQSGPLGFKTHFGRRQYEVRGLEKGPRNLKVTVRVEHAGKLHVDSLDLYSARARRTFCKDLSRVFEESAGIIQGDITRLIKLCEEHEIEEEPSTAEPATVMTAAQREEAQAFGKDPQLIERIKEDYETCGLIGEHDNKLFCYLAAVSRKLPDPLSVLILSSSGAGKSSLQDATLLFCPPEDVVKVTSLTGKALFYKGRSSLKHKILALEEEAGAQSAAYALRNLISAKELIIETTVKDPGSGKMTTAQNRVEGPTAVFVTTTNPETDPETRSRFFVTSVDESREQTRAILEHQRERQTRVERQSGSVTQVLRRHHNFQRLLRRVKVVNPYATQLAYGDDRLQSRRDQPKYLNLIQAVAFLRQMSKAIDDDNCIAVDLADIRVANELAAQIMGRCLDDLNSVSRDLLLVLESMVESRIAAARKIDKNNVPTSTDIVFTRRDIREYSGWPHVRVERYLKQLVDMEYVIVESGQNGKRYQYRLAYEGQGSNGERFIMGLSQVEGINEP